MATFKLKTIAYDKVFFEGDAQAVFIPALDGAYQILANHESCVVAIDAGVLRIVDANGKNLSGICSQGVLRFDSKTNSAERVVATIERPEEIDVRRAQEAKERAEEELRQKRSLAEYEQSRRALARAMARLKGADKKINS